MLLLAQSLVRRYFEDAGYLAPFLILLLAGAGLPVPEEVTMTGSGFLCFRGAVEFWPIVVTCYTATLLGDSIPYWLGRRYGMSALRFRVVAKVVHPERMALLERRFEQHGNWAVFTCRFLPGVRLPGWFMAGTLGMSYTRFIILDGIAAAEFGLAGSMLVISFEPLNGFVNFGTPDNLLLLAPPGCPTEDVLVGRITVEASVSVDRDSWGRTKSRYRR